MDKNLINIDDLVRQRLMGGEERERAGAWLRMSELLEEEMPQRPVGFIWRRMFGALAIILLISAASLGGYELYSHRQLNSSDAVIASASALSDNMTNNKVNNTQLTASATTDNNSDKNNQVNNNNDKNNKPIAANVKQTNKESKKQVHKKSLTAQNTTTKTEEPVANNESSDKRVIPHITAKEFADENKTTPTDKPADKKDVAVSETKTKKHTDSHKSTADNHKATADNTVVTPAGKDISKEKTVATTKTRSHKSHNTAAPVSMDKLAVSSSAPEAVAPKTDATKEGTVGVKHAHKNSITPLALNSHSSTTTKHAPVANITDKKSTTGVTHKTKHTGEKVAATVPATKNNPAKPLAINRKIKTLTTPIGNEKKTVSEPVEQHETVKRVIQKLVINQHSIRISARETATHMDTISLESITESFDLVKKNDNGAKKGDDGAKKGGDELAANTQSDNDNNATLKPASSSSENESTGTKVNNTNTQTKGAAALEGLNAAFNEIKFKAGHAQFAAGLTAGVNGTFLGPNSFKGFQFGMTGKFIFSEALALMGELKYFHRINNSYELNDNYYSYTPVAGGYSKNLVQNPYSISTLHSIEMPITIRYCLGSFNFFVGGNLVYTFAINTGDYPMTIQSPTPVIVSAPGNDNEPKIKPNDFNSRFGMGYTFGASLQVSPKVTIDFRDVQTFWDNAKTPGAKYISSQLYKSPSFQLSLGYRLGGNKKEKE